MNYKDITENKELNKTILNNVKNILSRFPITRDCDKELFLHYFEMIFNPVNPQITYEEYLCMPPESSLSRARRKLQAEFPALRGNKYNERKNLVEPVQESLGYIKTKEGMHGTTP